MPRTAAIVVAAVATIAAAILGSPGCTNDYDALLTGESAAASGGASTVASTSTASGSGGGADGGKGGSGSAGGAAATGGAGGSAGGGGCPKNTADCDGDGDCEGLDEPENCGQCGVVCGEGWTCGGADEGCRCTQDTACVIAGRIDEAGCQEATGLCVCMGNTACNPGEHCTDAGDDKWDICTCGSMASGCTRNWSCVGGACVEP